MLEHIDNTALRLGRAGVKAGDRVGVLSENTCAYAVLAAACWRMGAVVVPLSTRYPVEKIRSVVGDMDCRLFIVSDLFAGMRLGDSSPAMAEFVDCGREETKAVGLEDLKVDPDNDASVIMTSGSGGTSRGVVHKISNHYYSALGSHENIPFGSGDRWLMSLPMYHISGFSLLMRAFLHGGTIGFTARDERLVESVLKRGATHISLVAVQLYELLEDATCVERLKGYKAILIGGAHVGVSLIEKALEYGLPIHTTYGSTECASQVATTAAGDLNEDKHTSGKVLPYREVKIAGDGEILVKGKTLFQGYVQGDAVKPQFDKEGFFHTGDVGRVDEEGRLYVFGRKDSMFISGGENIYPEEIEKKIEKICGVERAIVAGIGVGSMGKRPVAFIKSHRDGSVNPEFVEKRLREELEGFKVPIAFFPMPTEQAGRMKPDREGLRKLAEMLFKKP